MRQVAARGRHLYRCEGPVTGNAGSSKVGTAEAKGYLGVVALGDASIQAAAREAGITRIHHVDYQAKSYVGVYTIYTIIVYGD